MWPVQSGASTVPRPGRRWDSDELAFYYNSLYFPAVDGAMLVLEHGEDYDGPVFMSLSTTKSSKNKLGLFTEAIGPRFI